MCGVERDESAKFGLIEGTGGVSSSAMSACLRAQSVREPRSHLATIFGVSPLSPSATEHYSDAVNELETAVALAALGSDWMVAHSTKSANNRVTADHIVLGCSGVFLVSSRQHPFARIMTAGRMIMVNGHRVAHVRDAIIGADRLTAEMESFGAIAAVRPVVIVGGASSLIHGRMRAPVPVLQPGELVRWILHQPTVYSANEVKALVAIAGRLASWQVRPLAGNASVRLTARFERLRAEVDVARQRYRLWILAGGMVAIAATVIILVIVAPAIVGLFAG